RSAIVIHYRQGDTFSYKLRYTRRRLGGRQPLWGTGVTSRIAVTSRPAACNERIADSRPAPGPLTVTSNDFIPSSIADFAAASAAICAAKVVDLREPLYPSAPAELQPITLPWRSEEHTSELQSRFDL